MRLQDSTSSEPTWSDPWAWSEFRRMRRNLAIASAAVVISILAFIPAGWIILVPTDPTFRPDVTTQAAWITLGVCAFLVYMSQRMARLTRERFDRAVYQVTRAAKSAAAARGIAFDIDMGETFPPLQISRQQRIIAFCGPSPLLVPMDKIVSVDEVSQESPGIYAPAQPHLAFVLKDMDMSRLSAISGRGFGNASTDQVRALREKIGEFLDLGHEWDVKVVKTVDVSAFIDSMRPKPNV